MPHLLNLADFPYVEQEEDSFECVPACIAMVCQYWGLTKTWDEIAEEVGYSPDEGTPFGNVGLLSGARVIPVGTVTRIEGYLSAVRPAPVIANLSIRNPSVLGYSADVPMMHAVVVVGIEDDHVTFFDPLSLVQLSTTGPTGCTLRAFEAAWLGGWVIFPG